MMKFVMWSALLFLVAASEGVSMTDSSVVPLRLVEEHPTRLSTNDASDHSQDTLSDGAIDEAPSGDIVQMNCCISAFQLVSALPYCQPEPYCVLIRSISVTTGLLKSVYGLCLDVAKHLQVWICGKTQEQMWEYNDVTHQVPTHPPIHVACNTKVMKHQLQMIQNASHNFLYQLVFCHWCDYFRFLRFEI